jgi:glycosyltransferase involved in cell wall biosynthesis
MPTKRALVLSYSPIARDPRVRRQIQWLKSSGFEVDVYGLGSAPNVGESDYQEIMTPSLPARLMHYIFSSVKKRESTFISSRILSLVQAVPISETYDLAVLNDLDFLGADAFFAMCEEQNTRIALDLHEYFYHVGGSLVFRILHGRYYRWLLKKLETRKFAQLFTVSEAIARLYEKSLRVRPVALENSPDSSRTATLMMKSEELKTNNKVRLIHHGTFGKGRGIIRLIRAMRLVDTRFELHLMLIISDWSRLFVQALVSILGLDKRVFLIDPVPMSEILRKLASFDVEVIFYHPPHSTNELYSLPNKFFESLASGLAIVVGPSPSMAEIVTVHEIGVVAPSWTKESLANSINSLTPSSINAAKAKTASALVHFDAARAKDKFCNALNI